jgi:single-stranded DNA-binding protein
MNNGTYIVNLGADPETIRLGEKEGMKLRCAEKAGGKKAITRWFNAIVTGYDAETAARLAKGDTLALAGQLALTEYKPKKPRYKGEMVRADEMPFAKILQVIKSPTFFGEAEKADEGEEPAEGGTDITEVEDPLAGL